MLRALCLCGAEYPVDHDEGQVSISRRSACCERHYGELPHSTPSRLQDVFCDDPPAWAQRLEEASAAASEQPCLPDSSATSVCSSYFPGETPAGIRPLYCLWQVT